VIDDGTRKTNRTKRSKPNENGVLLYGAFVLQRSAISVYTIRILHRKHRIRFDRVCINNKLGGSILEKMEQKNKTFNLNDMWRGFFIGSFVIAHFLDIGTTLTAKYTKTVFNESNILVLNGVPLWAVMVLKVAVVVTVVYMLTKFNPKIGMWSRYIFSYLLVISTILTYTAVIGNIDYIQTPDEELVPLSKEVLEEAYIENFEEMENLTDLAPQKVSSSNAFLILNLLQFWVFKVFHQDAERRRKSKVPV